MHILVTRPHLERSLKAHEDRYGEDAHQLVDRLLMGFFSMDAPWTTRKDWQLDTTSKKP